MTIYTTIRNSYATYENLRTKQKENHKIRIIFTFFISLVALFFATNSPTTHSLILTGITILAGFTFSALFSVHVLSDSGLPAPKNENDRLDRSVLKVLSKNFLSRASYFIELSIFAVLLLVISSIKITLLELLDVYIRNAFFFDSGVPDWLTLTCPPLRPQS